MTQNIFDGLEALGSGERFSELLRRQDVVIERIQSSDDVDHGIYDQDHDEWVLLLEGSAVLEVSGTTVHLKSGDHLFLPAHTPHRVLQTQPSPRCIWLAVHLGPNDSVVKQTSPRWDAAAIKSAISEVDVIREQEREHLNPNRVGVCIRGIQVQERGRRFLRGQQ